MPRGKKTATLHMPILALRGLMVFPHMVLHFDVGRDKSVAALEQAMMDNQEIFLVAQRDAEAVDPTEAQLCQVGTIAHVKQVLNLPGDSMRVLVEGLRRATLVTITSFTENFSTHGICALLALVGLFIMAALYLHHVRGAILLGILATWVIGMICQVAGIYVPDPANGFYTLFPTMALTDFSKLGLTFGQCFNVDFSNVGIVNFIIVVFSFLFVDIFDTLGTLIGVATKADMLDEEGRLPGIKPALMADAIGTTVGAVMGTSTITTFVESASGVAVGGRTGLTALTTGLLFLASMFFAPIFTAIPSFATAPALMMVGYLMVSTVTEIRFDEDNMAEAIPAYLAIVAMPLFYSISEGISMGIISYVVLHVLSGKGKQVKPLMYVLAVLFVLKYIFL